MEGGREGVRKGVEREGGGREGVRRLEPGGREGGR